jgi:DNA invertase Pin-like site-specific DNA recombinase
VLLVAVSSCRGFYPTRPAAQGCNRTLSATAVTELRVRIAAGISKAKVAREFGISRQTLYQYLQEGDDAA